MEKIKATVESLDGKHFIKIEGGDEDIRIPMSEDKPNEVKGAFNKLITRLKNGQFQIELEGLAEDLFSQVAKEYITQLNRDLLEVHGEIEEYGLVDERVVTT